jgi:hypothetical protein
MLVKLEVYTAVSDRSSSPQNTKALTPIHLSQKSLEFLPAQASH